MHTVASPPVTYLLLTIGLSLLIFEFFTAGVGVAGVVGAGCVVLACYGLGVLPIHGWALAVLLLAFFGLAVDVQTGVPRLWTGIGLALYVVGSLALFRSGLRPSWITLSAGIGGVAFAFIVGMPSMVRARFATPTIGREWMIGELGEAAVAIDPEGVALVGGAQWRARTNRATPLARGDPAAGGGDRRLHPRGGARDGWSEGPPGAPRPWARAGAAVTCRRPRGSPSGAALGPRRDHGPRGTGHREGGSAASVRGQGAPGRRVSL